MSEPGCPVARTCGGCPLINHAPRQIQALHENRLRDGLRRHVGESPARLPIDWVTMPHPQGYRRRIRLRILSDARLGFFNPEKSVDCAVLTQPLRQAMHRLVDTAKRNTTALSALQHVELREPDLEGMASAYFVKHAIDRPLAVDALDALGEWLDGMYWAVAGDTISLPQQRLQLPAVWQRVPIGGFLQVNHAVNMRLLEDLLTQTQHRGLQSFCDLYAGSGNFALPLLARGLVGHAVEVDINAARAARLAASAQNLLHGEFEIGDAGEFARQAVSSGRSFDLVIVDPPRAGIRQNLLSMANIARKHFVYCSCNIDTLSRDLGSLHQLGFAMESITLYDMFPGTSHIESLVWLRAPMGTAG